MRVDAVKNVWNFYHEWCLNEDFPVDFINKDGLRSRKGKEVMWGNRGIVTNVTSKYGENMMEEDENEEEAAEEDKVEEEEEENFTHAINAVDDDEHLEDEGEGKKQREEGNTNSIPLPSEDSPASYATSQKRQEEFLRSLCSLGATNSLLMSYPRL